MTHKAELSPFTIF